MNPFVKKRYRKVLVTLVALFAVLFLFRLTYGYKIVPDSKVTAPQHFMLDQQTEVTVLNVRKNYASKKYQQLNGMTPVSVDQKYEKIASIHSYTSKFEQEEKKIRALTKDYDGLIQFENKSGNKGYRKLNLTIGIPPENFDSIYAELVKIGRVQSKQITKTDKTNEYKELNAKKTSLEKIRSSLIELKSKGGRIDEYMQLENRILEIEQQLQELGVSLGNFDDENEFCTVKVILSESAIHTVSLLQRIKVAFEWTVKYYLLTMVGLSFAMLFAYLLILSIEKIKVKL